MACMQARAGRADEALQYLDDFVNSFRKCSLLKVDNLPGHFLNMDTQELRTLKLLEEIKGSSGKGNSQQGAAANADKPRG